MRRDALRRARLLGRRRTVQTVSNDRLHRAQRDLLSTWGAVGFSPSAVRTAGASRRHVLH